jgi:hypothetical protein
MTKRFTDPLTSGEVIFFIPYKKTHLSLVLYYLCFGK